MIPFNFEQTIGKIAALVLLITACRNSPSRTAQVAPDTLHPQQQTTTQSATHHSDSTKSGPGPSAVRNFMLDLNGDGLPDTISLILAPKDTNDFTTVAIAIKGYGRRWFRVADSKNPWTDYDDWFADSSTNAVHTRRFFLRKGPTYAVLLLFGGIDETSVREGFTVIKIYQGEARQVMDQVTQHLDIENVLSLRDLDSDGRFELICNHTFEFDGSPDTLGGLVGPYNPYYVYTIDDSCLLNKRLMRRYNQEKYLFAGYEFSDKIRVFYPDDRSQKPRLWKP